MSDGVPQASGGLNALISAHIEERADTEDKQSKTRILL